MSRVFRKALVYQIVLIDPMHGIRRNEIGQAPGRDMLRMGLADLVERGDGESYLELTDLGRGARELAVDLKEALACCDRMRESVVEGIVAVRQARVQLGAAAPDRLDAVRQSRGPTCGTTNHDSFATFITNLNAAGKNRWRQPGYAGQVEKHDPAA